MLKHCKNTLEDVVRPYSINPKKTISLTAQTVVFGIAAGWTYHKGWDAVAIGFGSLTVAMGTALYFFAKDIQQRYENIGAQIVEKGLIGAARDPKDWPLMREYFQNNHRSMEECDQAIEAAKAWKEH